MISHIFNKGMEKSIKEQESSNEGNFADIRIRKCQVYFNFSYFFFFKFRKLSIKIYLMLFYKNTPLILVIFDLACGTFKGVCGCNVRLQYNSKRLQRQM